MAKDPAFLFYHHDFLIGTAFLSLEERGAYITILSHMAAQGSALSLKQIMVICGNFDPKELLKSKFKLDEDGNYYNNRLLEEINKRKKFTQSRLDNLHKAPHMGSDMDNVNRNVNRVKDSNDDSCFNKKENFEHAWSKYPVKDGKKAAERSFNSSVNNQEEMTRLMAAMTNYLKSEKVLKGYVKNGSTFFANWKDWETYIAPKNEAKPPVEMIVLTCIAQKMTDVQIKSEVLKKGYSEHQAVEGIMKARGEKK